MQTIVFIESSKSGTSREALIAANEMGFYTVLITNRKKYLKQKAEFPEVNEMIFLQPLLDKETVLKQIRTLKAKGKEIRACLSFIDPYVSYAASLSEELGLMKLSCDALFIMEDKTKVRETLKDQPSSPYFTVFSYHEPISKYAEKLEHQLPLILKSPVSNGSRDVFLAKTKREVIRILKKFKKKYPQAPVLIEEYLMGPQYLIEVMVYNDQINIMAVIQQEILSDERFIVTGYLFPAILETREYDRLVKIVTNIIQRIGISNGTCHLEMRHTACGWKLIEINPRMSGGAMNRILLEGTGVNYVQEIIKLNLGEKPTLKHNRMNYVYARFLTIHSSGKLINVTGENHAAKLEGVKEVIIKPATGSILSIPNSLGDRYAYVIASATTPEKARQFALHAAREIKFYLEPL